MYLGMTFEQAARSFGWGELCNFSNHLPETSATFRALYRDAWTFSTALQQSSLLADLSDALNGFMYMFGKAHGGKGSKPKPYPRPWASGDSKHIGSEPIPISEFDSWYYGGE